MTEERRKEVLLTEIKIIRNRLSKMKKILEDKSRSLNYEQEDFIERTYKDALHL